MKIPIELSRKKSAYSVYVYGELDVRLFPNKRLNVDLKNIEIWVSHGLNRDKQKQIITLTQESYTDKILERFKFADMHPQRTPMVTTQTSNRERKQREDESDVETLTRTKTNVNAPYREAVGSLLYLANATRPDISYAVNVLSRHQIEPTENDWTMVKRVFRYLKGTKNKGLTYLAERNDLQAFSDASHADCKGSLTTCGCAIKLYGDTVSWKTHKLTSVTCSTCESEYVAMSETCRELISLENSLKFIFYDSFCPMTLWCDNKAAAANAETNGGNKLRHISVISEHYVRQCVERNQVKIKWISTRDQIADIFTKPLSFELHKRLSNIIMNERND